jgi:protein-disulfide isomerase
MLSDYGIENAGTKIHDKETDLFNIELPFIAHTGSDFVVVYKIAGDQVHYLWNGKKITLSITQFIQSWSGIILLTETSPKSIEPEYKAHKKQELFGLAQIVLLFGAIGGTLLFAGIQHAIFQNIGLTVLLLINLIGVYTGYLLVLKQIKIQSKYADKICSLFSKSDCNNVLESDVAKLWGVFGWSEIGLGYFVANVLLILFLPQWISFVAILNLVTLPYTFWSVWYQKFKAKQWCPLCLIVQGLLWCVFLLNLLFGFIQLPVFDGNTLGVFLFIACIYGVCILVLNLLVPKLGNNSSIEQLNQEINSIKAHEDVFKTLLTKQPCYEVSKTDSQILFGNPKSHLQITIFTNPFCNPCAKMHKRVEQFLQDTKGNVCIQYIFSSFHPDLDFANKALIEAYLEKEQNKFERIIGDWFEKGKPLKEAFFDGLQLDMTNPAIEAEFQKHENWKAKTQLRATPTILVNGYKLPDNYKIEDLRYFVNLEIDVNQSLPR